MAEKSNSEVARVAFLWVSNAALAAAGVACLFLGVITLWQKGDLAAAGTGLTAGLVFLLTELRIWCLSMSDAYVASRDCTPSKEAGQISD